uniref:Uncharacterized protein n=1 Tax=Romanomermis culicivorax TaxID=13658 RepID=A0A915JN42_ROMCU
MISVCQNVIIVIFGSF